MPQEIKKRYVTRFKPKTLRPNKQDDKIKIFKRNLNMELDDTKRIERQNENENENENEMTLDVTTLGINNDMRMAQNPEKILDFNIFNLPLVVSSLSPDQVEDIRRDKNVEVVYEDRPADVKPFGIVSSTDIESSAADAGILPFAPSDDAKNREYVTENVKRLRPITVGIIARDGASV